MKLAQLNLFQTRSRDPDIIRQQILTTRLFILLFSLALLVLLAYTSISERTQTHIIQQPSLANFQTLSLNYPDTLQCTCQQISILPSHFVTTTPRFHQVCSSNFVLQSWIDLTFGVNTRSMYDARDIRNFFSSMWQIIANLCRIAINAISAALTEFGNGPLITSQVSTQPLLEAQIQSRLVEARQSSNENFIREFLTIQTISQINAYTTGLLNNFLMIALLYPGFDLFPTTVIMLERNYIQNNTPTLCWCHRALSCPSQAGVFEAIPFGGVADFQQGFYIFNRTLPGIVFDCLPVLATFASSLECFYNQSCIDSVQQAFSRSINVSSLKRNEPSRFPMSMSLGNIIDELFVEEFINSTSFSAYYNECAPISCTYTFSQRFDRVFIFTTFVGLVGGLNAALRMITPYVIAWILFVKKKLFRKRNEEATGTYRKTKEIESISK